ncbi:MAG TPA: hypothetical protein VKB05_10910 [Pyrinomonadaceae bacterium]|nr:hypothetical protein [Pyrinomonadaceae bacterium]
MVRRMFLLVMLGTFLALGGFWALRAQDPAPQQTPTQTTTQTEKQTMPRSRQLDLSGTYTGTFANCDAGGLNGDTTLTITGDQFTTSDGKSGRIIASKTKGYTAVAVQMSGANSPVMSFRGKKSGNKLTLSPVAGATSQCMFTTSKTSSSSSTATGTTVASPSTTTPSTMPSQSPSPTPSPSPEASPEPNPSPSGSPRPGPSPSPTEPAPSPTPTPSPSPRF